MDLTASLEHLLLARGITEFLFDESAALDEARHDQWLDMLTEDFEYHVPIPISPESPYASQYSERTSFSRETKGSLKLRFDRIASEYAWVERPRHLLRHFVSNIRVAPGGTDGEWTAKSSVLVARARPTEPTTVTTAARTDVIRGSVTEGFRLARRTVYLDVGVPHASQLIAVY